MKQVETTLGAISIKGRGTYGIAAPAVPKRDGLYTYLRITDITDDGCLIRSGLQSVEDETAKEYLLHPNDIVFARTGASTGRTYFYDGSEGDLVYAGFLIKFSLDPEKVYPKYVKYYCLSDEYRAWVAGHSVGSTRGNCNASDYASMPIKLPPLPIQQKIADILGAYDDLIENNRRRIELLEKMARELYRERFVRRAVGVKEFPLGEIAEFVRGKVIVKTATIPGDVPVVAGGLEPAYYHNDSNTKAPVVTVSGSGANAGFARMYFEKVWASDCSWVDAAGTKYIRFVYCFLKDNDAVLRNAQKGAAQPHVHAKDVNALTVAAEKTVISGFEESVIPIFDELANLEQQTRSLVKQRDRLLPRLMSGKIELDKLVKEAE